MSVPLNEWTGLLVEGVCSVAVFVKLTHWFGLLLSFSSGKLRGGTVVENKGNFESGQNKIKTCSHILKDRECNSLFVTMDTSCNLYFKRDNILQLHTSNSFVDYQLPCPPVMRRHSGLGVVVGWLLNVPPTCQCISGTDLLRQFYVLPHSDSNCRSNFPSHPVTVY